MIGVKEPPVLEGYTRLKHRFIDEMREAAAIHQERITPAFYPHYARKLRHECLDDAEVIDFMFSDGECKAVAFTEDKGRGRYIVVPSHNGELEVFFDGDEPPTRSSLSLHAHIASIVFCDEIVIPPEKWK